MAPVLTTALVTDRRAAPRLAPEHFGVEDAASVRPGTPVALIVISTTAALVESLVPIRPGARTELTLGATDGRRVAVGAEVLRCWVTGLAPVRYRSVIRFDEPAASGSG